MIFVLVRREYRYTFHAQHNRPAHTLAHTHTHTHTHTILNTMVSNLGLVCLRERSPEKPKTLTETIPGYLIGDISPWSAGTCHPAQGGGCDAHDILRSIICICAGKGLPVLDDGEEG